LELIREESDVENGQAGSIPGKTGWIVVRRPYSMLTVYGNLIKALLNYAVHKW
jgi:hypothetical protein